VVCKKIKIRKKGRKNKVYSATADIALDAWRQFLGVYIYRYNIWLFNSTKV
jgi:hypothetical protein